MFFKCAVLALTLSVAYARTAASNQNALPQEAARSEESNSFYSDIKFMYKVYQECSAVDLSSCLKLKLISAMDRVARAYSEVPIFSGVTFVKDVNATPEATTKSEAEIESSLPRAITERENALNSMITDKIFHFFETHTLQVSY